MESEQLKNEIIQKIKTIYDPELPVNIWDLGLIYEINIFPINNVHILMTLTSPNCPAAQTLPLDVKNKISEIEKINTVEVEITWNPSWDREKLSWEAKFDLGFI